MTTAAVRDTSSARTAPPPQDSSPADQAAALVRQATEPATGRVDTRALGAWVADAARQDPATASAAHAAIEDHLLKSSPGDVARFNEDVAAARLGPPSGLAGAGQGLVRSGTKVLVDNPILTKRWEATRSAWTGKGGFTPQLQRELAARGIEMNHRPYAPPAGSLGKTSGVPLAKANNTNGTLARDAIAAREATQPNSQVATERTREKYARRVDIVVDRPAADPRMSERVEIESKTGRTSADRMVMDQVRKDADALADNRVLRKSGFALERIGKVARPVGIVLDAVSLRKAYQADGNRIGEQTGRTASGIAGGAVGGWGGAVGGAAIGTMILPGVGTVVGGVIGGALGAFGGDAAGKGVFDTVKSWF
jgi:hypothetical protein